MYITEKQLTETIHHLTIDLECSSDFGNSAIIAVKIKNAYEILDIMVNEKTVELYTKPYIIITESLKLGRFIIDSKLELDESPIAIICVDQKSELYLQTCFMSCIKMVEKIYLLFAIPHYSYYDNEYAKIEVAENEALPDTIARFFKNPKDYKANKEN